MDRDYEKFTDVINKQVHSEYRDTINVQKTTIEKVRNIIRILADRKAPGHDGITNTAIKHLTLEAVDTLKEIINAIIRHQYYPKTWKHATIIIIHKSGKPKNKTDGYRPINLLPGLIKILERVIQKRLLSVVEEKSIIPRFQFGFRRKHLTTHQLRRMSEHITSNMDKSMPTAAIMFSMSSEKAFDKVWHDSLIHKIRLHWIPAMLTNLIQHYFRDRSLSVKIEEDISTSRITQAGVPQGSVLGPLLFNIYTSDIPQSNTCHIAQFAR
ncbi:hypothetical protein Trydic_g17085 [Trypoxylus dichotomus]